MSLSQEQIIANVMGYWPPVSNGRKIYVRNTLRGDRKPGCWFQYKWGYIRLFDHGDKLYNHANYVDLVALKHFGVRTENKPEIVPEVMKIIKEMSGGKVTQAGTYSEDDFNFQLRWEGKGLTKEVIDFYAQFKIPAEQLKQDRVEAVEWYDYNSRSTPGLYERHYPTDLCIALPRGSRVKIYRPYQGDGPWHKWMTDTVRDDYYHWPRKDDLVVITGSHKDGRAVFNHGYSVWAWQSETNFPSEHSVKKFAKYKNIVYLGDIDEGGRNNAKANIESFERLGMDVKDARMPLSLYSKHNIKDFAELVRRHPEHSGDILKKTIERCLTINTQF